MRKSSDEQWRALTRRYEPPVSDADWKSLAGRMDRYNRRRRTLLRFGTFFIAGGIILGAGWLALPGNSAGKPQLSSKGQRSPVAVSPVKKAGVPYAGQERAIALHKPLAKAEIRSVPKPITAYNNTVYMPGMAFFETVQPIAQLPYFHATLDHMRADGFPKDLSKVQENTVASKPGTIRPRPRAGKTYLVLYAQPGWVNNRYQEPSADDKTVNRNYVAIRNEQEQSAAGIVAGIDLRTPVWNNIYVSGGLALNTITSQVNYNYQKVEIPYFDPSGNIGGYFSTTDTINIQVKSRNVQTYAELPVVISWQPMSFGKFSLEAGLGASMMYLVNVNMRQIDSKELTVNDYQSPNSFSRWNSSLIGRAELGCQLSANWRAAMALQYQKVLKNTDPGGTAGRSTPSSMGLRLAIGYRLF